MNKKNDKKEKKEVIQKTDPKKLALLKKRKRSKRIFHRA